MLVRVSARLKLAFLCITTVITEATERPNILVIVADDLGWNDVDWHGSNQIPTPNLSRLAREGVILDNYYVQPVCSPTRSSLLTGRHVIHSGIYDPDCDPGTTRAVPMNFTMLPIHLAKLGYESHAVGKWHLGMFSRSVVPTGKGFKTFLGYYGGAEDYFTHRDGIGHDMHNDTQEQLQPSRRNKGEYSTFIYTRRTSQIIADFSARRMQVERDDSATPSLFVYLAYQAIHSPDEVPDSYRDRFTKTIPDTADGVGQHRRTVAGMVACLDEGVGNVTSALVSAGMMNSTLIVFTTDNGGPAQGFNSNMASNWPLRGMKRTLWQGGVRGAAFVHGAGIAKSGYISHGLMHVCDWFPTLLTAAVRGLAPSADEAHDWRSLVDPAAAPSWQLGDGIDVWPMLSTGAASARSEVLIEAHNKVDDGNGQAIIVGELKLILEKGPEWHGRPNDLWYESGSNPLLYNHTIRCTQPPPAEASKVEPPCLFNLTADPCEYHDLKHSLPDEFKKLKSHLEVYQKTSVTKDFHTLPMCKNPSSPLHRPVRGNWMPVCP